MAPHGEERPGEQESLKQKLRSEPVSLPLLPRWSEGLVKLCPVQVDRVVCWSWLCVGQVGVLWVASVSVHGCYVVDVLCAGRGCKWVARVMCVGASLVLYMLIVLCVRMKTCPPAHHPAGSRGSQLKHIYSTTERNSW